MLVFCLAIFDFCSLLLLPLYPKYVGQCERRVALGVGYWGVVGVIVDAEAVNCACSRGVVVQNIT